MSDFVPRDRQTVFITIPATAEVGGAGIDYWFDAYDEEGDSQRVAVSVDQVRHAEAAPVVLPTGFGARIRATVTCACGDEGSGVPVPDVLLVGNLRGDDWTAQALPCGCRNVVPTQTGGGDVLTDVVVLYAGEPS